MTKRTGKAPTEIAVKPKRAAIGATRWVAGLAAAVVGAELDYVVAALALRVDPVRGEFSPSAGFVFPSVVLPDVLFGGCAVAGRPQRADVGVARLPSITTTPDQTHATQRRTDAPAQVVAQWGQRAQTELASVPAFRELAQQLHVLGAPAALIDRSHQAARDELHHAMLAASHCSVIGSRRVQLESNSASARPPLAGPQGMVRLAVESWVDGCLGEGLAASAASHEAQLASDDDLKRSQQLIARDEAQHAELAWDVLAWTLRAGGREVQNAVHAVAEAAVPESASPAHDRRFEAFGILGGEQHRALSITHRQQSLQRLHETLLAT